MSVCILNIAKGTTDPRVEFISQDLTQILIKVHFQNFDQALTSKSQPNITISTKIKLKILEQTLCSKSEQKFSSMTKPHLPNLQQTVANTILIINISNSNNLNKLLSSHTRVTSIKFTKRQLVSELVS